MRSVVVARLRLRAGAAGKSLWVRRLKPPDEPGLPLELYQFELATAHEAPTYTLMPPDSTGVSIDEVTVFMTADGKSLVYGYPRETSELFVVEGLR